MIASMNLQQCRQLYRSLRDPCPWLNEQLSELTAQEKSCKAVLQDAAARSSEPVFIRTKQQELNKIRADLRRYRHSLYDYEEPTPAAIDREFECLITLPGAFQINDCRNRLILFVRCQTPYNGRMYDRGDWSLRLGRPTANDAVVQELRTGVRPDWMGGYPDYRLGEGSYCFGPRNLQILKLLGSGQLLAGASLIIDCLQAVNPEDRLDIPYAFFEVAPR